LIPFWRASLDLTFESASSHQSDTFIIMAQFAELVRGVRELAGVGVQHGDINDRNVLYFSSLVAPVNGKPYRLVLVDFAKVASFRRKGLPNIKNIRRFVPKVMQLR
jgi:hypothetical protein